MFPEVIKETEPSVMASQRFYYPKSDESSTSSDYITHKNVVDGYKMASTTHGIQHIHRSKGIIKKLIWTIAVIGSTAGLVYQLYLVTSLYLTYNVLTTVVKQTSRTQMFPAVTVCNTNPLKASAIKSSQSLQKLVDNWQKKTTRKKRHVNMDTPFENHDSEREKRQAVTCPTLYPPENGYYKGGTCSTSVSIPGTVCEVMCNDTSNTLYGNPAILCQNDGTWNMTERPCCIGSCPSTVSGLPCGMTMRALNVDGMLRDTRLAIFDTSTVKHDGMITQWRFYSEKVHTFYPSIWRPLQGTYDFQLVGYNTVTSAVSTTEQVFSVPLDKQIKTSVGDCLGVFVSSGTSLKLASEKQSATRTPGLLDIDVLEANRYSVSADDILGQADFQVNSTNFDNSRKKTTALSATVSSCIEETTTMSEQTTTLSKETTTMSDETTTMSKETTTMSDETTTMSDGTTTISDETTTMSDETTTMLEQTTTMSDKTTSIPETTIVPEISTQQVSTTMSTTTAATTTTVQSTSSLYPDREPPRQDFVQETEVLEVLADIPEEVKKTMGYELYDLILSCQYENQNCNMSDFGQFFDAVYGNCFVFNWRNTNTSTGLLSRKSGHSSGLEFVINLGQHEYIQGISQSAGIVVVVHPANRMPFPEDEGVFASPGHITSIGIDKVSMSRLPHPYGNCSEDNDNPYINVFAKHYNVQYSVPACYKTCYQKYVLERCNCSDPQYPSKGVAFGNHNWTSCSVKNSRQDDCVYGVLMDYIGDALQCDCPTLCRETVYKYSLSHGLWPPEVHKDVFINQFKASLGDYQNYSSIDAFLNSNIAKIEVYFNEFNYRYIYEKPKYPINFYLADVCAIIGLWLGMSLLSITEFLELAVDLAIVSCFKFKKKTVLRMCEKPVEMQRISNSKDQMTPYSQKLNLTDSANKNQTYGRSMHRDLYSKNLNNNFKSNNNFEQDQQYDVSRTRNVNSGELESDMILECNNKDGKARRRNLKKNPLLRSSKSSKELAKKVRNKESDLRSTEYQHLELSDKRWSGPDTSDNISKAAQKEEKILGGKHRRSSTVKTEKDNVTNNQSYYNAPHKEQDVFKDEYRHFSTDKVKDETTETTEADSERRTLHLPYLETIIEHF